MPRNTDASGNAINLTSAQIVSRYWKDVYSNNHFGNLRTQTDVIRELYYKNGKMMLQEINMLHQALVGMGRLEDKTLGCFIDYMNERGVRGWGEVIYAGKDRDGLLNICERVPNLCYEVVLGHTKPQWKTSTIKIYETTIYKMRNDMIEVSAGSDAMIADAKREATRILEDAKTKISQCEEMLKEERSMTASLQKIITKNGIELPHQCDCGEIYEESEVFTDIIYTGREVLVYDETTGEVIKEVETEPSVRELQLYRPLWHCHRGSNEDKICWKCIIGHSSNNYKCSPCFQPNPAKTPKVIGYPNMKMTTPLYEYHTPQCRTCLSSMDKHNCYAWNKNKYLVVPLMDKVVKELVGRFARSNNTYTSILPSEVKGLVAELGRDMITRITIPTHTGTHYRGGMEVYEYEPVVRDKPVIQALRQEAY
jgi:hypothetical protein